MVHLDERRSARTGDDIKIAVGIPEADRATAVRLACEAYFHKLS